MIQTCAVNEKHLLFGERYKRLVAWAVVLHKDSSNASFRRDMRRVLNAGIKDKVAKKQMLDGIHYVSALIQGVIYEALYSKDYIVNLNLNFHFD